MFFVVYSAAQNRLGFLPTVPGPSVVWALLVEDGGRTGVYCDCLVLRMVVDRKMTVVAFLIHLQVSIIRNRRSISKEEVKYIFFMQNSNTVK